MLALPENRAQAALDSAGNRAGEAAQRLARLALSMRRKDECGLHQHDCVVLAGELVEIVELLIGGQDHNPHASREAQGLRRPRRSARNGPQTVSVESR